ncbi:MAG TPA: undecaprenyl-phosphate glucose phosphotransferase [Vineibacter sp.]|nr:undecaprenyl-phosphate glucose phosphotransferase [Vineibacter sp.]
MAETEPVVAPDRRRHVAPRLTPSVITRLVAAMDGIVVLATGLASAQFGPVIAELDWRAVAPIVVLGALLVANALYLLGAYKIDTLGRLVTATAQVAAALLVGIAALGLIAWVAGAAIPATVNWFVLWLTGGVAALGLIRLALSWLITVWRRQGKLGAVVAVLGVGAVARRFVMQVNARRDPDMRIVNLYADGPEERAAGMHCLGYRIAGDVDDLVADVRRLGITTVVVALPLSADLRLAAVLNKLSQVPVDIRLCPDEFALQLGRLDVSHVGDVTLLNIMDRPLRDWRRVAKGIEDRLLATAILALISPLMLAIAALIKFDSPGPVLFRQKRYGLNNELIEVLKFRTMYDESRDDNAEQLTRRNDPRVTRLGAFLRRTSLDELPQFINVLRGEMSIVGPRPHALAAKAGPLLYQEAVRYYDSRHRMKPGITGWAQVNGWRGETDTIEKIRKRVEHDLYYIEHWSIGLDLKIILRTVFGGFTGGHAY